MSKHPLVFPLLILVCCLLMAVPAVAQVEGDKVIYKKEFPQSYPPLQQVVVPWTGPLVYTDDEEGAEPIEFDIPAEARKQIFDLAREAGFFGTKLESGLKVANMGTKTFTYEGSHSQSQSYNYTAVPPAQKLQSLFEKITDTQRLYIRLEYAMQFDRLGVNDALLALSLAQQQERLLGGEHLLPMLDEIINSNRYMNISRNRADMIARGIRGANAAAGQ
jgi:hypothetical protein